MKRLLYCLFALDFLTIALYLPVFAVHVQSLGATNFQIGVINSSAALISLVWNPISGSLSDSKGRRGLLVKCLVAGLVGNFLMGITSSLKLLFVGKLLTACSSPVNILLKTIVTDLYGNQKEKNAFFQQSIIIATVTFMVGSLASGFISAVHNGNYYVFLLLSIIFAIEIVLAYNLPNDTKETKSKKTKNKNKSTIQTALSEIQAAVGNIKNINWSTYWDIFLVKGAFDFSFGIFAANIGLIIVHDYKLSGPQRGLFFTMLSVFAIVANVLKKKFGKEANYQQIFYACIVTLFCYISFGFDTHIYVFLALVGTYNMGRAFLDTTFVQVVTSRTKENDRGKVISAFDNLFPLAMFVSPLISGFVADRIGERKTTGLAAIPAAVAVAISFIQQK